MQDVFSGNSPNADRQTSELQGYEEIDCLINGDIALKCRKEGDEVYLPFSFIHKYFEVCNSEDLIVAPLPFVLIKIKM